jgi:two-component system osmolarity sensor histidine kinase EnvZ
VVERVAPLGVDVSLNVPQDVQLSLRREAMRRALANLVNNAARHARTVTVDLERRPGQVVVLIDDDGPGIPEDKRAEVFRPFVRLDSSRNPATGGTGLGLTIARDIVRGHGGELQLEDAPLGGLRARVVLPT